MGSGTRKTNPLINMISWETDAKNLFVCQESKESKISIVN